MHCVVFELNNIPLLKSKFEQYLVLNKHKHLLQKENIIDIIFRLWILLQFGNNLLKIIHNDIPNIIFLFLLKWPFPITQYIRPPGNLPNGAPGHPTEEEWKAFNDGSGNEDGGHSGAEDEFDGFGEWGWKYVLEMIKKNYY